MAKLKTITAKDIILNANPRFTGLIYVQNNTHKD